MQTVTTIGLPAPADDDDAALAPSAAPVPRPRSRAGWPPAPGSPDPGSPATDAPSPAAALSGEDDPSDPSLARLRAVLELTAAGKTQIEIGRALNCSERTVRTLLKEARARQVAAFKSRSGEDVVADLDYKLSANHARWLGLLEQAERDRDLRLKERVLTKIDANISVRAGILARVGFFDSVQFKPPTSGDPHQRRRRRDSQDLAFMDAIITASLRGEDMSDNDVRELRAEIGFDDEANDVEPIY